MFRASPLFGASFFCLVQRLVKTAALVDQYLKAHNTIYIGVDCCVRLLFAVHCAASACGGVGAVLRAATAMHQYENNTAYVGELQ